VIPTHAPGATPLDPAEAAGLLPTSIATQEELNAFEQANILDAEAWALRRKRREVLTETFTRDLHRRMFSQVWSWAGHYRTSDKNLGIAWPQIPVIFSWGRTTLAAPGAAREQYIAALKAADRRDFAPLIAFVRS
jgi:fido (protein-threonine AMPylation protein)